MQRVFSVLTLDCSFILKRYKYFLLLLICRFCHADKPSIMSPCGCTCDSFRSGDLQSAPPCGVRIGGDRAAVGWPNPAGTVVYDAARDAAPVAPPERAGPRGEEWTPSSQKIGVAARMDHGSSGTGEYISDSAVIPRNLERMGGTIGSHRIPVPSLGSAWRCVPGAIRHQARTRSGSLARAFRWNPIRTLCGRGLLEEKVSCGPRRSRRRPRHRGARTRSYPSRCRTRYHR